MIRRGGALYASTSQPWDDSQKNESDGIDGKIGADVHHPGGQNAALFFIQIIEQDSCQKQGGDEQRHQRQSDFGVANHGIQLAQLALVAQHQLADALAQLGLDGYLAKPFRSNALLVHTIEAARERRQQAQEREKLEGQLAATKKQLERR